MTYEEVLDKILAIPMFQNVGISAFVPTLDGSVRLNKRLNNPYNSYPTVHIAGTNGKGSTSSMLTSVLMESGYRVGCYTSPHLSDYRERVRINGRNVSKEIVCDFVAQLGDEIEVHHPSFFEVTTALAFYAFEREKVDLAIIETGLGGLTDSTNIIRPILSIITNIGFDHKYLLGNTLSEIAFQKGGILKEGIPVVIGEHGEESDKVFITIAEEKSSHLVFAEDTLKIESYTPDNKNIVLNNGQQYELDLGGEYQRKNLITVLCAIEELRRSGVVTIPSEAVIRGLSNVCKNSGLEGRWQKISDQPLVICDTGHNEDGIRYITHQLSEMKYDHLFLVIGFMADKEVDKILWMFPKTAHYFFTPASNPRSMSGERLCELAAMYGLKGEAYSSVEEAYHSAASRATPSDMIFVGGSTFIVADFLGSISEHKEL